jgi:hypothetical protein
MPIREQPKIEPDNHFLAVFAAALNALAVGAPLVPGLRIFSFEPSAIRLRLA